MRTLRHQDLRTYRHLPIRPFLFAFAAVLCSGLPAYVLRLSATEAKCRYESLDPQQQTARVHTKCWRVPIIIIPLKGCRRSLNMFVGPSCLPVVAAVPVVLAACPHPEESKCTRIRLRVEAFIGHFSKGYDLIVYGMMSYALYERLGGLGCRRLTHELALCCLQVSVAAYQHVHFFDEFDFRHSK